jgi:hypothetical protein
MSSFARLLTVSASTKRPPAVANGKRGELAAHLGALKCSPLDPISAELSQRVALNTPHEVLQAFIGSDDVREGDVLTVGGREYPIRAVEDWANFRGVTFRVMVLEDIKR